MSETSTAIVPASQSALAYSVNDIDYMGRVVARSGLFGIKSPEQAAALMLVAQAEGRHPASVAMDYHVIQGRPALKSERMLARFQALGGKVRWIDHTDQKVSAEFSHPQGGSVVIDWTMERAKAANLTGKDNWRSYPRQMLRARVISEGVRACFPAACGGVYTPEEVQDFANGNGEPEPQPRRVEGRVIDATTSQLPDDNPDAPPPPPPQPAPEDDPHSDQALRVAANNYRKRNNATAEEVREIIKTIGGAESIAKVAAELREPLLMALNATKAEVGV